MVDYSERQVFPGGCFFAATSAEFNHRPGPVRDRIEAMIRSWLSYLEHAVEQAQAGRRAEPGDERADDRVPARRLRPVGELAVPALPRPDGLRRGAPRDPRAPREPAPGVIAHTGRDFAIPPRQAGLNSLQSSSIVRSRLTRCATSDGEVLTARTTQSSPTSRTLMQPGDCSKLPRNARPPVRA